jgi:hypothetical protein
MGKIEIWVPLLLLPVAEAKETLPDGNVLNPELPWEEKDGKLRLHIQDQDMAFHEHISYELHLLCILHKPSGPGPTVIDWYPRFTPEGCRRLARSVRACFD